MGMYCEVSVASPEDRGRLSPDADTLVGLPRAAATASSVSLEKAWHGLHYLLTGEVDDAEGPAPPESQGRGRCRAACHAAVDGS